MECYKEFAHIYDELINSDIDYNKWGKVVLDICNEFNVNQVDYLDLCCGTGNITTEIAPSFTNSWAVDLSYEMLTKAEQKLRSKGLKVKFVCQNMCELNLNKKFDLITCCLDSTNYIIETSDIKKYFLAINNHLKDNGIFIFDINSYHKLANILGNNVYNYDDENVTYIWENTFENRIVDMYLTFFVKQGELYRRFDEEHRERAYEHKEIEVLLKESSLQIVKVMDNYETNIISNDTERIVYVVKKKDI
ncbi:class I SAM-dependent methyltransferase [Clostridium sp. DJ247]|uniref:class I SAM-dependent DNA methyltransferase n=1 Tax=Clostridium sp. DJ247 TaxID=2726188 RepID=UPI00162ADE8A|nr:class I SAM-dependent methyltransferase [Clostridium sp. DJ247]MBC2580292.1 class I SAM-dependent methyltransferase [Clostridium sp. DJ247]